MTVSTIAVAIGIFILRVVGNALTTLRMVMNSRGHLVGAFIIAIIESLMFALALGVVVNNLDSILNLMAYSVGFAVGGYVAMRLEQRLLNYYIEVTAISVDKGHVIAEVIREHGFGATETDGHGAQGDVTIIKSVIERKQLNECLAVIHEIDDHAFVTIEGLRKTEHGYVSYEMRGIKKLFNQ